MRAVVRPAEHRLAGGSAARGQSEASRTRPERPVILRRMPAAWAGNGGSAYRLNVRQGDGGLRRWQQADRDQHGVHFRVWICEPARRSLIVERFSFLRPAWAFARRCGVRRACQVLYWPGRGNGELKARVPVARRDLKEAGDKPLARRTGTA